MALLTVQTPSDSGSALSLAAADVAGDSYPNSGKEMLVVENGSGGAINVTFVNQAQCTLGTVHAAGAVSGPHSVGAGVTRYFPGKDAARFNDENGRCNVTYDSVTSVTVGVMRTT